MRGFAEKTIIVCGGATGIGAATTERLAAEGARVVVGDLNRELAEATADRIRVSGGTAIAAEFDLADEVSIRELISRSLSEFGSIHGLFNVGADLSPATLGRDHDLLEMDPAVWRRTFEVNLLGFARTCREVIPHFLKQGGGAIVNTTSGAYFVGEPTRPAYAASKAGVNTLTRHIASRWGKNGIRCNGVSPGFVLTETARRTLSETDLSAALERNHSTRLGEPSDLASAVTFLLSDEAEWINGQVWVIDGGKAFRD
ncbi:SDR family oxidoreductase [Rhodococcus sp. IEGM 1366]|uniref:SDR family NAD(P)-dependent oxidoreductase n=1 Tax=Rhodococcus sp. IEGM 1366 TaxID=3082223 RepID=UPI00295455BC|nr:SDR family oxidoreductase [Rhodococcus sp. IEGM 1366]MDV8071365.1 SDR family oxidoreductase [Rhodococcus sp. IEGM 1366]